MNDLSFFKFDILESTQDKAFELLEKFDEVIVISERMTKGRGRYGNTWISEVGGLYMSIGFKNKDVDFSKKLLIITPIAVLDVLEQCSISASIKLPNDIYFESKKLCGILIEMKDRDVVLGIGLNVNQLEFPKEINAISMALIKNNLFNIDEIAIKIYKNLKTLIFSDFKYILKIYSEKIERKMVEFSYNDKVYVGRIIRVNEDFEVVLDIGKFNIFCIRNLKYLA